MTAYLMGWLMPHRPLTDRDMALITVLCQDRETRCGERATAAAEAGDRERQKIALADLWRYRTLRLKMFSLA
jgi:hypothetical protein